MYTYITFFFNSGVENKGFVLVNYLEVLYGEFIFPGMAGTGLDILTLSSGQVLFV